MRYYVSFDKASRAVATLVDLVERPDGALDVHVDGRRVTVDAVAVGSELSVCVDGRLVDLATEGMPPELGAIARGQRSPVHVESEQTRSRARAKPSESEGGERVIKSPMPGRVVKVLVARGDTVTVGQGLVVLEAMKMENEVRAKSGGTVAEVHVTPGTAIEGNARLVTLA